MRNIPFAFVNEETIEQINQADERRRENVNAFAKLAETQAAMRGVMSWADVSGQPLSIGAMLRAGWHRFMVLLEKMMEMSGPNSIANLERALRAQASRRRN